MRGRVALAVLKLMINLSDELSWRLANENGSRFFRTDPRVFESGWLAARQDARGQRDLHLTDGVLEHGNGRHRIGRAYAHRVGRRFIDGGRAIASIENAEGLAIVRVAHERLLRDDNTDGYSD